MAYLKKKKKEPLFRIFEATEMIQLMMLRCFFIQAVAPT